MVLTVNTQQFNTKFHIAGHAQSHKNGHVSIVGNCVLSHNISCIEPLQSPPLCLGLAGQHEVEVCPVQSRCVHGEVTQGRRIGIVHVGEALGAVDSRPQVAASRL